MSSIEIQALKNVRVVLMRTSHPGNIGSAARAMKTMGLSQLCLVDPKRFPDPKAVEMCSNATDVLEAATVFSSFEEAITGCDLVIGTSARLRSIPWPLLTPRQCGDKAMQTAMKDAQVAIVFGNEQSGLSNEELQRCQFHVNIPANPNYSSLNLASSVQVLAYEVRMSALGDNLVLQDAVDELATDQDMVYFFEHLETTLRDLRFLKDSNPRQMMTRFKRLFNRLTLEKQEVRLLRGIFSAIKKREEAK